jgi:hypothetical protein
MKYLFYFHPLDNLQTLWGSPAVLNECEQADDLIRLFQAVHWASSNWSKTVHFCQKDSISLRSLLIRSKSLVMAAYHNYHIMENEVAVHNNFQQIEQERHQVLNADLSEQRDLAKASFRRAAQTLAASDWDINDWMFLKGLSEGFGKGKKIRLSEKHIVIFDDPSKSIYENFHQHFHGMHVTYLPPFYYEIGYLVAQPYIHLEPSLYKLWGVQGKIHRHNPKLEQANEKWNEAFWNNVNNFRRAGVNPLALDVYPFNVQKVDPIMIKLLKQVLPSVIRNRIRAKVLSLKGQH